MKKSQSCPDKAIRIRGPGIVSLKNDRAEAQSVRSHVRLLNIPVTLTLRPEESFSDVKCRKNGWNRSAVHHAKRETVSEAELCFDPDKEILVREGLCRIRFTGICHLFVVHSLWPEAISGKDKDILLRDSRLTSK